MNFTFFGTDPRFFHLKKRLEQDGHHLAPDSENIIAPPAARRGIPYYDDPIYALENAALTAEGAVELLMRRLPGPLLGAELLVAGYGRIGSLLAQKLAALGARVTVAARSELARSAARTCGYAAVALENIPSSFQAVINTIPAPVLAGDYGGAICLDLASAPGGWRESASVLRAPGLPGLYAPRAAADIMAEAIYRTAGGADHV